MVQQKVWARSQGRGSFLFCMKEFTTEPGYECAVFVAKTLGECLYMFAQI